MAAARRTLRDTPPSRPSATSSRQTDLVTRLLPERDRILASSHTDDEVRASVILDNSLVADRPGVARRHGYLPAVEWHHHRETLLRAHLRGIPDKMVEPADTRRQCWNDRCLCPHDWLT